MVEIVLFGNVYISVVPLNKGTKTTYTFGNFHSLIGGNRSVSFFLLADELLSPLESYTENVFTFIK